MKFKTILLILRLFSFLIGKTKRQQKRKTGKENDSTGARGEKK